MFAESKPDCQGKLDEPAGLAVLIIAVSFVQRLPFIDNTHRKALLESGIYKHCSRNTQRLTCSRTGHEISVKECFLNGGVMFSFLVFFYCSTNSQAQVQHFKSDQQTVKLLFSTTREATGKAYLIHTVEETLPFEQTFDALHYCVHLALECP